MKKKTGLSLLETMVTLFLMGIMLALVAQLIRDLQQETLVNLDHDQRLGAHQALDRVGQALRSNYQIDEPATPGSAPRLVVKAWNPLQNDTRLPLPVPLTGSWDPKDPAWLMVRRFELNQGILLCTHIRGGNSDSVRLLGNVDQFQVTRRADGRFHLLLTWTDTRGRSQSLGRLSLAGRL